MGSARTVKHQVVMALRPSLDSNPSCCLRFTAPPYGCSCRRANVSELDHQLCVDQHAGVEQTLRVERALGRG
jgi:hypothetical protein